MSTRVYIFKPVINISTKIEIFHPGGIIYTLVEIFMPRWKYFLPDGNILTEIGIVNFCFIN